MIVTEYEVGPGAYGVALGADGAAWTSLTGRGELARVGRGHPGWGCWATLWAASSAVRLDRDGGIAQEVGFEPGAEPHEIALGPDRSVWIALETGTLVHLTESG
jgi:virginiamycin B lyase